MKPWHEKSEQEKKTRIRRLWSKVRMYVRLRNVVNAVNLDVELRELENMQ